MEGQVKSTSPFFYSLNRKAFISAALPMLMYKKIYLDEKYIMSFSLPVTTFKKFPDDPLNN